MARLPDVLRERHWSGLDRAEAIRRKDRRRRLQEGSGRRRPLQVCLVHAGRRAGHEVDIAYSIRGELADELQHTRGLTLKATVPGSQWLYFADQWDPSSPWHDERVRRAANLAMDRKGINDAITMGQSHLTNSIIPESFEFYWQPPEPVYDPANARHLL